MRNFFINVRAIFLSTAVHVVLLAALLASMEIGSPSRTAVQQEVPVVQATVVEEAQVQAEIGRLEEAERERQERLEQQAKEAEKTLAELEEKRRLEARLKRADLMLELQKKVSEILGIRLDPPPSDGSDL